MAKEERRYTKNLNLTREQLERHFREKFCWGEGSIKAFKNKEDLEEQAKKDGRKVIWYE